MKTSENDFITSRCDHVFLNERYLKYVEIKSTNDAENRIEIVWNLSYIFRDNYCRLSLSLSSGYFYFSLREH